MNLEELHNSGKLNDYMYDKLKNSSLLSIIDPEDVDGIIQDFVMMSSFGVSSKDDEKLAQSILLHVSDIINDIKDSNFEIGPDLMYELYIELFNNKKLLGSDNIFCTVAEAANIVGIPLKDITKEECDISKIAYPQGGYNNNVRPVYDISRWVQATRDIYSRTNRTGKPYYLVFNEVTSKWDDMEKINFKHWLRFYSEGVPAKYPKLANKVTVKKVQAQFFGDKGFFLPPSELPQPEGFDELKPKKPDQNEIRDKIETQRAKIISRLTSAERLLASIDGQGFAGDDQELMLKLLQDLKRKVQTANKITIHSSLFEDLIYRAGNAMRDIYGSNKSDFFFKIAQEIDPFAGAMPPGQDTALPPSESVGNSKKQTEQAFREFEERLEDGEYNSLDDPDEIKAKRKENEAVKATSVSKNMAQQMPPSPPSPPKVPPSVPAVTGSFDGDIIVTAQDIGGITEDEIGEAEVSPQEDKPRQERPKLAPEAVSPRMPSPPAEEDITVTETEIDEPQEDSDDVIEAALSDITVQDAIDRLEILVGLYKKREIPRQLSILDIMMDTLGLSSYFPSLGEAMAKALESSQYISTRLEDVLNKLKGSVESGDADRWLSNKPEPTPETKGIQDNLQAAHDKEEERKKLRKERDNAKLEKGEKGKTGVGEQAEELAQPAQVETGKPVAVR